MKTITIERSKRGTSDYATFGIMLDGCIPFAVTLEPPIGKSIKAGTYPAVLYMSPKRNRWVYLLKDVPGHTAIEIHSGNLPGDTEGCILTGESFSPIHDNKGKLIGQGIADSRKAFFELLGHIGGDEEFFLQILEGK